MMGTPLGNPFIETLCLGPKPFLPLLLTARDWFSAGNYMILYLIASVSVPMLFLFVLFVWVNFSVFKPSSSASDLLQKRSTQKHT